MERCKSHRSILPWKQMYPEQLNQRKNLYIRTIKMGKSVIMNLWSSKDPVADVVTSRASSRKRTRQLPSLDNCSSTLLNCSDEFSVQPTQSKYEDEIKVCFKRKERLLNSMAWHTNHSSFLTSSRTGFSPDEVCTLAWLTSGYCVDEWFPQMITFLTSDTGTLNLSEI